jgi:hypothetical protein
VAAPKGEGARIRREVRKRNALKKIIKAVKEEWLQKKKLNKFC